jgi:hypothetical protein
MPDEEAYEDWFAAQSDSWQLHPHLAFRAGWYAALDRLHQEVLGSPIETEVLEAIRRIRRPQRARSNRPLR